MVHTVMCVCACVCYNTLQCFKFCHATFLFVPTFMLYFLFTLKYLSMQCSEFCDIFLALTTD
jgi:hypothetical protein